MAIFWAIIIHCTIEKNWMTLLAGGIHISMKCFHLFTGDFDLLLVQGAASADLSLLQNCKTWQTLSRRRNASGIWMERERLWIEFTAKLQWSENVDRDLCSVRFTSSANLKILPKKKLNIFFFIVYVEIHRSNTGSIGAVLFVMVRFFGVVHDAKWHKYCAGHDGATSDKQRNDEYDHFSEFDSSECKWRWIRMVHDGSIDHSGLILLLLCSVSGKNRADRNAENVKY